MATTQLILGKDYNHVLAYSTPISNTTAFFRLATPENATITVPSDAYSFLVSVTGGSVDVSIALINTPTVVPDPVLPNRTMATVIGSRLFDLTGVDWAGAPSPGILHFKASSTDIDVTVEFFR